MFNNLFLELWRFHCKSLLWRHLRRWSRCIKSVDQSTVRRHRVGAPWENETGQYTILLSSFGWGKGFYSRSTKEWNRYPLQPIAINQDIFSGRNNGRWSVQTDRKIKKTENTQIRTTEKTDRTKHRCFKKAYIWIFFIIVCKHCRIFVPTFQLIRPYRTSKLNEENSEWRLFLTTVYSEIKNVQRWHHFALFRLLFHYTTVNINHW